MSELPKKSQPEENSKKEFDFESILANYFNSMSLGDLLDIYREANPDVYDPNQDEIDSFAESITSKVSKKDMVDFVEIAREFDIDDAELYLASKLAEAYGIKNMPNIVHVDADAADPDSSDRTGYYDHTSNTVLLYFGDDCLDSRSEYVDALSHELWHARQYEAIDNGEKRGELYKINYKYYLTPQNSSLDEYMQQIVEAEAISIGRKMSEAFLDAQYSCLDSDSLTELRSLKEKYDIHDWTDLRKAFMEKKINQDEAGLLASDFVAMARQ